jgi:short-subunit dehydrogenase
MDPNKAAKIIYNRIDQNKKRIYFPWQTSFLAKIISNIPDALFEYLMKRKK